MGNALTEGERLKCKQGKSKIVSAVLPLLGLACGKVLSLRNGKRVGYKYCYKWYKGGYGHPIMDILLGISIPILEVIPNSQLLEDNHQEKCRKAVVPGAVLWMKFRNTMQEPYSHTF